MEKLQVPGNITLRWELWQGAGWPELVAILITTAISAIPAALFCVLKAGKGGIPALVFYLVVAFAFSCGFFTRMDGNQSIYDFFRRQARYRKEQQTFYYVKQKEVCFLVEKED